MKVEKELLMKFAKGECTEEEAKAVHAYLDDHPGELENYFPLNDWLSESDSNLDPVASERMLEQVRLTYEAEKPVSNTRVLMRYAVAASLIGLTVFSGIKLLQKPAKNPQEITFIAKSIADSVQTLQTIENKTSKVMAVSLPDGSTITMYPRSAINYLPEFEKDKRALYLNGKALFKVSKDKTRPFTVYAEGIAITALGTSFQVAELKGRKISVALLEGSIKVWPQNSVKQDGVVLHPGDKLIVNSQHFNSYTLQKKPKKNKQPARGEKAGNPENPGTAMVFKNDRLEVVFKKIEARFDITVNYEAVPGIGEESFTGTFLEDDGLEFICKTICNLHGLQYKKDGKVLTILKP